MQNRVLDAADILIDRHPVIDRRAIHRDLGMRAAEAREIPGAVDEGVERIGLPPCRGTAARAGDVLPGRMMIQRIARPVERHVVGQYHRQLIVRHRHHAAGIAVDNRDRAAPVALPADAPVAQPPVHLALADAQTLQFGDRRPLRRLDLEPIQEARVEDRAGTDIGLIADREDRRILARRQHHRHHVQSVLPGELEIALVVSRATEDRPGAVFHQHEVGDPHRDRSRPSGTGARPAARCRSRASPRSRSLPRRCPSGGIRR